MRERHGHGNRSAPLLYTVDPTDAAAPFCPFIDATHDSKYGCTGRAHKPATHSTRNRFMAHRFAHFMRGRTLILNGDSVTRWGAHDAASSCWPEPPQANHRLYGRHDGLRPWLDAG